ncbi:MAG TPA: sensor histidine kinase [Pseudomonadota bacterium]|jgi:signal transduction histidine kinase|nr:sensor histidine kinase [Pseudomonadota bacterium]
MLLLTVLTAIVIQVSAPTAYYLAKRHELWLEARSFATQTAGLLRSEIEQQNGLWQYNTPKLTERLASEGLLSGRHLVIRTADNQAVSVFADPLPIRPLWGRADTHVQGDRVARVYVALDMGPLLRTTLWLGFSFAGLSLLVGALLYVLPVFAVSTAQRRIERLLAELALAMQEEDRRRIARELHDGVGQALTAARLKIMTLEAHPALADLSKLLDDALMDIRRSVERLSPLSLSDLGLSEALHRHCESFSAATGLSVFCEVDELPPLSAQLETACYRIVQESLTNTAKHAHAKRAWVQLRVEEDHLLLAVYDDGRANTPTLVWGQGLRGISERARLLDGNASISLDKNGSLRVEVTLPIHANTTVPIQKR